MKKIAHEYHMIMDEWLNSTSFVTKFVAAKWLELTPFEFEEAQCSKGAVTNKTECIIEHVISIEI